jgi:lysophospholipase L1-like esterase
VEQVALARAAEGAHVIFVDNYAAIYDVANWQTALMADNLHPNDAGYAVLGQSFFAAIDEYLP